MCGEQALPPSPHPLRRGSPPRVRGTAFSHGLLAHRKRITPACAGNSPFSLILIGTVWDHPRVCGEQPNIDICILFHAGSPPRVRGTVTRTGKTFVCQRITPACAGNSNVVNIFKSLFKDHPRVCGEQMEIYNQNPAGMGSPPRVRGTEYGALDERKRRGITPACAGNR